MNRRSFVAALAALPVAGKALETLARIRTHYTATDVLRDREAGRFSGIKLRKANYGIFVDGREKPYRIYVTDHRTGRFREVTKLLPRLRA